MAITVDTETSTINATTPAVAINPAVKKTNKVRTNEQMPMNNVGNIRMNQPSILGSVGAPNISTGNLPNDVVVKSKEYNTKKFPGDLDSKMKNYRNQSIKESTINHQDYKYRSGNVTAKLPPRFANHSPSIHVLHRETNHVPFGTQHSRPQSRNDAPVFTAARKASDHQISGPKIAQVNFPPLRAPQSIVNVRHPFLTEARTKRGEITVSTIKPKSSNINSIQNSIKELEPSRQTFHCYSTSPIASIPNVQNLGSITNIPQYPRAESFPQATIASVLFPETPQFPQSPPFGTAPVGQLNQFQTYDPGSFTNSPLTVNPVIPQFPTESPIPYPQFESPPQFVQTNHYPSAELTNSQYQYQTAGVGQIQESPLFIQSLQSPIAVSDQYAAPNYARAVRTELIPRFRRPPRLNK